MFRRSFGTTSVLLSAAIFTTAIGCGSSAQMNNLRADDKNEIRVYEVHGMGCPGCHGGLEKLINKLTGVVESRANWEKDELKILVDRESDLNDESVFDAVRRANFTPGKRSK